MERLFNGGKAMTPAELLKFQMKKTWENFSEEELYRIFCLLIDQIDTLEKQNKSLKKDIHQQLQHKNETESKKNKILKSHVRRDAMKIIEETEKMSKDIITQTVEAMERVRHETKLLEQQQLKLKTEMIKFIESKIEEV